MKICSFINSFWLIACIFCIVSCDEESDFITGPTTSSTMISGVARTADGMPLAGVQVSLDYKESVWLGQQVTRDVNIMSIILALIKMEVIVIKEQFLSIIVRFDVFRHYIHIFRK